MKEKRSHPDPMIVISPQGLRVIDVGNAGGPADQSDENDGNLFLSQLHPISNRHAIIEDDGRCGWLYLTHPGTTEPAGGCWLYNRIEAPDELDQASIAKGIVPTAPAGHMKDPAPSIPPDPRTTWFRWGSDGESVAVITGSPPYPLGYILAGQRRGRSFGLKGSSLFGSAIDWDEFEDVFNMIL